MAGYIYAIKSPASGFVKVGMTQYPKKRIRGIELGSGVAVEIIGVVRVRFPKDIEPKIHVELEPYREIGEWFSCPSEKVEAVIRRICTNDLRRRVWSRKGYFIRAKVFQKRPQVDQLEKL